MNWLEKLLVSFGYKGWAEYFASLYPSIKYDYMPLLTVSLAGLSGLIVKLFGLDAYAFIALLLAFLFDIATGLLKSIKSHEKIESFKLSRFSFKLGYYLLSIALFHLLSVSFENQEKSLAADVMGWLYATTIILIVLENTISIAENIAVLDGKNKEHWIYKVQEKIHKLLFEK